MQTIKWIYTNVLVSLISDHFRFGGKADEENELKMGLMWNAFNNTGNNNTGNNNTELS